MKNCLGRAALAAMLIFGAARTNAQITTVVATPPKRNQPSPQAVAQREQAAQDSVARVTLTGMKQWVDSAANALAIRPDTVPTTADTSIAAARPVAAAPGTESSARPPVTQPAPEFRDGARAPNTATPAPMIALAGLTLIAIGIAIRYRPRLARARARR